MKVECIKKTIDINKIHWAIDCFKAENRGENPSYIVMSCKTRAELVDYYYYITWLDSEKGIRKEDKLFGISIALNEGLEYGEVDII